MCARCTAAATAHVVVATTTTTTTTVVVDSEMPVAVSASTRNCNAALIGG